MKLVDHKDYILFAEGLIPKNIDLIKSVNAHDFIINENPIIEKTYQIYYFTCNKCNATVELHAYLDDFVNSIMRSFWSNIVDYNKYKTCNEMIMENVLL